MSANKEYKDSGNLWIGKIPANWDLTKLKTNFIYEKGKNAALYTKEYVGLHKGIYPVYSGQTEDGGVMGTIDTFDYDVDECVFSTTVGAKVMTPMLLSGKFSLSQNCLIMKPTGMYSCKMLYYCLDSLFDYERKLIPAYMQPSLRFADLNKYCLPQPSIQEQEKIVDHLDKECARINSLVEKQRNIIEKLKEYKKSVITEAVTKGLNPNVKMKNSGIEWIGKFPSHWEVVRMKSGIAKRDGGAWGTDANNSEGDCICLRIADFDYSKFRFADATDLTIRHYTRDVIEKLQLKKADILIEKSGGGEKTPVGRTVLFDKDYKAVYANFMDRLRCSDIVKPKYMQYIFVTFYENGYTRNYIKQTTGIQNLDLTSMLSKELMALPSQLEQQAIVDYLDQKCAEIDSVIEKREKMIELLTKYKKSLIYECVTGKKEVA